MSNKTFLFVIFYLASVLFFAGGTALNSFPVRAWQLTRDINKAYESGAISYEQSVQMNNKAQGIMQFYQSAEFDYSGLKAYLSEVQQ